MEGVFLSYRRDDTADDARRIYERLADRFGGELVFLDVEDIPLGEDFVEHIGRALEQAAYVLIAIGPRWLLVTDEDGRRRLDDPDDLVRYEVRRALTGKKRVVPLLIAGARMPHARDLPPDIAALVRRNGIAIRRDPDFEADVAELMKGLHADRIDTARLPTVFRVGLVARSLGKGGALGWGAIGLVLALVSGEPLAFLWLPLAGLLAGYVGGGFVGWLTGLLIRHKSPPLVGRKLVQMGLIWSASLFLAVVIAGVFGYFAVMKFIDTPPSIETEPVEAENFLEAIGQAIGQAIAWTAVVLIVGTIIMGIYIVVGFVTGSALAATLFARMFRMRSDQISGKRGLVIAAVWLLGAFLTVTLFFILLAVPLA